MMFELIIWGCVSLAIGMFVGKEALFWFLVGVTLYMLITMVVDFWLDL